MHEQGGTGPLRGDFGLILTLSLPGNGGEVNDT